MMFIRHLAMLGALAAIAMPHPSAAQNNTIEPTAVETIEPTAIETIEPTIEPTAVETIEPTAIETTEPPTADDPLQIGTLYDEGCFCFHEEDLDAFLSFAAEADSCSVYDSEYEYTDEYGSYYSKSMSLSASFLSEDNVTTSRSFSVDDYGGTGGYCSSNVYYSDDGTGPSDLDGRGEGSESNYASLTDPYAGAISECQALIEAVKGQMTALGCDSYVYPCPYACVNGDCSADGCRCYDGWTGDSCEECDPSACVNGVCTEYGCECNLHWAWPTCTECVYGWTGVNCDECDPTLCGNGNCSDYGCECNLHWAYPTCTECEYGWTGDNCDECDPACMNGVCTEYGCECNLHWAYPTCTECESGWTGDNCEQCDPSACVNGNCTDTGCVCFEHFEGPPCTYCEYGWTGENCDECDPNACYNGNCTDAGCVCSGKWTGTYCDTCMVGWMGANCDTCEVGWTGTNCDACDAGVCADGYCSSCMNGQCTDSGCVCDPEWYGDKCDRVYGEGCPCFNEEDVDTFLNFAEIAGLSGSCYYDEDWPNYLGLYAYFNTAYYSIGASGTQCYSFRTYGTYVTIDAEESSVCRDIIVNTGAKDQMAAVGCYINEY